jgi:anthranilate synthase component I
MCVTCRAMSSLVTRTFPADHITPVRAYAALRAQSAGRSSYLFESFLPEPDDRWGRYAIIGYRARAESIYPSGFDPFTMLAADLTEPQPARDLAESVSRAWVGFIAYDALHQITNIEPWPTEAYLGRVMKDATVAVFDSVAQTVTIAGASQGAVNRCAWEMAHGPELASLPSPDPEALPEHLETTMRDEAYVVRVMRAQAHLTAGDATELLLARTFRSPLRGADPFDVYRALRLVAPAKHLYFIDFAESAFSPGLVIAGASTETLVRVERDPETGLRRGETSAVEALRSAFPSASTLGAPGARVSRIVRELEAGPRRVYGGAVGYFGLDGSAELALGLGTVWIEDGYFEVTVGTSIAADSKPEAEAEKTLRNARGPLSAIRAAHEARKVRDAAAERAAAAAAEKAAAEKAAAESEGAESVERAAGEG